MSAGDAAPDNGLSNERTALAWQRTALSIVAGAAVLGRLTFAQLGWVAIALLGLAILVGLWVFAESRWRYGQRRALRRRPGGRDGRATLLLTVAACLIAITEMCALLR